MTDDEAVAERVHLGVTVPLEELEPFIEDVEERWGGWLPYAGLELDVAWREYRDIHPAEEHAARLADAAGLPRSDPRKKNPDTRKPLGQYAEDEKVRTRVRVSRRTKEGIKQTAKADGTRQHEILRAVLAWWTEGGLAGRLADKLERVVDDAEAALRAAQGDVGGLTKGERIEIAIAQGLKKEFTRAELHDEIDAQTRGTDYFHDAYAPRVIERKGVVEHPTNPELFVQPETRDRWLRKQAGADADESLGSLNAAVADGGREDSTDNPQPSDIQS